MLDERAGGPVGTQKRKILHVVRFERRKNWSGVK
jgi:hypothetical protein